ncbi:MAG TPA: diacylglycerol kinase family protein [Gemmatimonadaceae bacterium]
MNACLIANPAAGRGRGARRLPHVREALAAVGIRDVRLTRFAGDERHLAAEAAASGIESIVALGGDGTWGNVARGIVESGRDARMVPIAGGTGNDFPHALGLPAHDPVAMARIAAGQASQRVDLGWAGEIAFLNVAGFGIETEVLRSTRRIARLSGPLLYVAAALPVLRSYRGFRAAMHVDGEPAAVPTDWCAIVISNGPRFGGGFRIAPGASVTDGLADVIAVRDALPLRRLQLFVRARLGTHEGQREVERRTASRLTLHFEHPPLLDADGELHTLQSTALPIRIQAAALRVGIARR